MPDLPEASPVLVGPIQSPAASGAVFSKTILWLRTENNGADARIVAKWIAAENVAAEAETTVCTTVPSNCAPRAENQYVHGVVRPATGAYFPCVVQITTTSALVIQAGAEIKENAEVQLSATYPIL